MMNEVFELYKDAIQAYEDSKNDSLEEPYKSKYAARDIFIEIRKLLVKIVENEDCLLNAARLAAIYYHIGIIAVETEEESLGEENFNNALSVLSDNIAYEECIVVAVSCYNQLGILWYERSDFEKGKSNLDVGFSLYSKFKESGYCEPATISSLFEYDMSIDSVKILESLHTHTIYYLAQVSKALGKTDYSASLCQMTLKRQFISKEYDVFDWSNNSASLAQYYLSIYHFRKALYLLAASWKVLLTVEEKEDVQIDDEDDSAFQRKENLVMNKADGSRAWGKYFVLLLEVSQDSIINQKEIIKASDDVELEEVNFTDLDVSEFDCYPYNCATNYEEAREIFLAGLKWLTIAKEYYNLEDFAGNHIDIVQDMSRLYKFLAFFEECEDRKSKMHKRRVHLLEPVVKQLNPQYYLNVCKQLYFELGEIYSAMLDCKHSLLSGHTPNVNQAKKINLLVKNSIQNFESFLNAFKDLNGTFPEKYSEDSARPVLIARFHLGRLWSKLIVFDDYSTSQNLSKSLDYYKEFTDYTQKYPESQSYVQQEYDVCREMVDLLPLKILRLRNKIN